MSACVAPPSEADPSGSGGSAAEGREAPAAGDEHEVPSRQRPEGEAGVRTEVREYIDDTYGENETARAAVTQLARAMQRQLEVDTPLAARQVANETAVAIVCLHRSGLGDTDARAALVQRTLDTDARVEGEQRFARMLSGSIVTIPGVVKCDHERMEVTR